MKHLECRKQVGDNIAAICKSRIVELAESEELYNNHLHTYTKSLLSAIPISDPDLEKDKILYEYDPMKNTGFQ